MQRALDLSDPSMCCDVVIILGSIISAASLHNLLNGLNINTLSS